MPNSELLNFIQNAKAKKVPEDTIRGQLLKTGWSEYDINEAMTPNSSSGINMPPPPVPHFGMWVAFQYIILFITLYIWATAFGGMLDYIVDKYLPDTLYARGGFNSFVMWYLACLIVVFPIFAFLFLVLKKQAINKPAVKNLRARKVLIYLTLVGTFLLMVVHLIITLFRFLNGSSTLNSFLHFLVTLFVAGSIFVYFLIEVWGDRKTDD